jgi:alpha-L-fucosidase
MKTNYFWESEKLITMIRQLQPGIMINNRFAWEGDFFDRERSAGGLKTDKPWDSDDCLTVSWGWMPDNPMFSLRESIKKLVDVVVRDGVFLLNVGPAAEGEIEERQENRLVQIGQWLEEYGESIYKTRGGPFSPGLWGGSTYRDRTIYIHINEWTEDVVTLPVLENKIVSYRSLTSKQLTVEQTDEGIKIFVPIKDRHPFDTIIVLELDSQVIWDGATEEEVLEYGLGDELHLKKEFK